MNENNPIKEIRVLHLSTHDEECGIGKYQENYLKYMSRIPGIHNEFFEASLNHLKRLTGDDLNAELQKFQQKLSGFDILHIQHEFGLYAGDGEGLGQFIDIGKALHKKVIVTIHTAPGLIYQEAFLQGYKPRQIAGHIRRTNNNKKIKERRLDPLLKADLVITLNTFTKNQLISLVGVDERRIKQIMIPVQEAESDKVSSDIRTKLKASASDIVLCSVGFMSEHKGIDHAIKALKFLPEKYKLAIIGGTNPDSGNPAVYDMLTDLILQYGLENRIYITGYIEDDEELYTLIRACDIALYPYSPAYYKLASSDAINKSLMNNVPVIAYPTESFKEINQNTPDAIVLTNSPNYYELTREVQRLDIAAQKKRGAQYAHDNSYAASAADMVDTYRALLNYN